MLTPDSRPLELAKADVVIANGASASAALDLGGLHLAAIAMPAVWTAAALSLQTSFDGVTWFDVFNSDGTELLLTVLASQYILLDFTKTIALGQMVRLRSGTSAAPVVQGGARTLSVVSRSF